MERWKLNLLILWVTQIISLTSFGLGLPFIPFYIQELGVTDPTQIKLYTGLLSAAPALTMAFMSPIWGMLADRFGRKLMIMRAMFAAVFIIGLMGLAQNVWHILFLRVMQGVFTGTITASAAFVASNTPDKKMSYALGLISSSTFIGQCFGPLIGGFFAENWGYRLSFFAGGALMFIGFILVLIFVKENPETYGDALLKNRTKGSFKDIFTPLVVIMLVTLFIQRIVRTIFSPFIPLYVQEIMQTSQGAAGMTGIVSGFTGFMTALAGISISQLGDKRDKFKLITGLTIISIALTTSIAYVSNFTGFVLLYGVMFFFLGGIDPIMTSLTAQSTAPERRGVLFGFQGLVGSVGFMMSPIIGTTISIKSSTHDILYVLPILLIVNLIILLSINYKRKRDVNEKEDQSIRG